MTLVRSIPIFVLALAASACNDKRADVGRDTQPAPADAPPALATAHQAYLAGDYLEMGERLKEVITDARTGELARDNAFALLESAYDAKHGQLPARATLPQGMKVITLGVLNGGNPFGSHRIIFLDMRVTDGRAAHIKDVRLTKLPNETILARGEQGRGTFRIQRMSDGTDDVKLEVRQPEVLPDRGAFAVQVVFDDGPGLDTFVLANKLVSSAQPEVTSPFAGQALSDPHPEIAWHPFRSPESASWEQRAMSLAVTREPDNQMAWDLYKWAPGELASVRVGAALEPDSYYFSMNCSEERVFGPVRVMRATEAGGPFSVVR